MKKCKFWGHKWIPVFIKGEYNGEMIKFIGCYCQRCFKGNSEILEIIRIATKREYGTHNEKYFDEKDKK